MSIINKKQKGLGVLTKPEIKKLNIIKLEKDQVDDEKCYAISSYDLRLGDEYYVPKPPVEDEKTKGSIIQQAESVLNCPYINEGLDSQIKKCSKDNHVLRIKPFTSIVISTYEILNMPNNVVGRFDLRIKWALQGLVLQVGTQIEPGYNGRLFGLLHNFSKKEICIPTMSRFLTAEFSYTSENTSHETGLKPMLKLEDFLSRFPAIDGTLENYLVKIEKVSEAMNKSIIETKERTDKAYKELLEGSRFKATIGLSIFVATIVLAFSIGIPLIITKLTIDKGDYPFKKVYEIENQNKQLNKTIFLLENDIIKLNKKIDSVNIVEKGVKQKVYEKK